jgi:hypothetical protein
LMPIASALAALGGVLLLFWRRLIGVVRSVIQKVSGVFR